MNREKRRGQLVRSPAECKEADRHGRTLGDGGGKKGWAGLGGRGLVRERRDPHGIEMGVGMDSRCEGSTDFFFSPSTVALRVPFPWSQQINGENYGQGVRCHHPL